MLIASQIISRAPSHNVPDGIIELAAAERPQQDRAGGEDPDELGERRARRDREHVVERQQEDVNGVRHHERPRQRIVAEHRQDGDDRRHERAELPSAEEQQSAQRREDRQRGVAASQNLLIMPILARRPGGCVGASVRGMGPLVSRAGEPRG